MEAKNINLCDLINILAWNMPVRILRKKDDCQLFEGISYKVPNMYLEWEVWEIKQTLGYLIIIVEEVK